MTAAEMTERNRANAQHSTGPKTPEGKTASSQNARKHGLSGKLVFQSKADADRFQKRIAELARYYKLSNPIASGIIEALVTAEFRRAQAYTAEQNVMVQLRLQVIDELEDGAPDPSDEELDGLARLKDAATTKLLPQLNRHYNAADRAWHKHFQILTEMKAAEDAQAKELAQFNAERAAFERRFGHLRKKAQNEPTASQETAAPAASEAAKGSAA